MSVQRPGVSYLTTHSGRLKIAEEILNLTVMICAIVKGNTLRQYFICFVSVSAIIITGVLLTLHCTKVVFKKTRVPWHWIECLYTFVYALLYTLASCIILLLWSQTYITSVLFGFFAAIIYFVDAVDKYQLATAPRKNYVWTTPNMPDLS